VLVANGIFPCTPIAPQFAVAIPLLNLYRSLFARTCDAIHALANALNTTYERTGFRMLNNEGNKTKDPFRKSLGNAVQWYDVLLMRTEDRLEQALYEADQLVQARRHEEPSSERPSVPSVDQLKPGECHRILRNACPACFGGSLYGKSFNYFVSSGGDIHVAVDGNMHHRHIRGAGKSNEFLESRRFLSKQYVDKVGEEMAKAKKRPSKPYKSAVPESAIQACHDSHHAAKGDIAGDSETTNGKGMEFDDKGVMAFVCRHDIPLFFANIDTPGEQQKYSIALIQFFFLLIPLIATVFILYDIGCVLDVSINKYDFLPLWITSRIMFATSAMHAYGHGWWCQLEYNPRLHTGLGLTDGEGVERLWSRLRRLIGVERRSSRPKRIWLIDRQADAIAMELKDGLGFWIQSKLDDGIANHEYIAHNALNEAGIPVSECRTQWTAQNPLQRALKGTADQKTSDRPAQLKKELDKVLGLQTDIQGVDKAIESATKAIRAAGATEESLVALAQLESIQTKLKDQVERLYSSLSITEEFPELEGIPIAVLRTLILSRDLKKSIRKRAVGSFWEWDRLDQSIGGRQQTIGTKLHQQTRAAISKRKPTLMTAIRKYNDYCALIRRQIQQHCHEDSPKIPLPEPLPSDLESLKESTNLMQDVLMTCSFDTLPAWTENAEVRQGIQATLKLDRCLEERRRLVTEADNLLRSFQRDLTAIEVALRLPQHQHLAILLNQRREHQLHLRSAWSTSLVSLVRFTSAVNTAQETANLIAGTSLVEVCWMTAQTSASMKAALPKKRRKAPSRPFLYSDELVAADIVHAEASRQDSDDEPEAQADANNVPSDTRSRALPDTDIVINVSEINILRTPSSWLNSGCINSLSSLLQLISLNSKCAVLSSYAIPRIADDAVLWKVLHRSKFWEKDIWLLPIHRIGEQHWVLSVIDTRRQKIGLFDSYAVSTMSNSQSQDIMRLIYCLKQLTAHHLGIILPFQTDSSSHWTVSPLYSEPVQGNSYDCGLWVLTIIAAFFRGAATTTISESDMEPVRRIFLKLVHLIPVVSRT
ncbi:hypothetical protein C8J56DRAFT_788625, partial [Mycena floridula]